MTDLKNGDNVNNIVEIGNNHIKYYNEILKISNITRTWIFKFQNVEKRKFEQEKLAYANAKAQYEATEKQKKNDFLKKSIFAAIVFLIVSIFAFSSQKNLIGLLFLCCTGISFFQAYSAYKKDINYPYLPPAEKMFPDKFGLGIEMNSGYKVTFTAIGDDGVRALRKLQIDIDEADVHNTTTVFNMNDYKITVENNDGIINTGGSTKNIFHREEQGY